MIHDLELEGRIRARVGASVARGDARDDARGVNPMAIGRVYFFDGFKRVGSSRGTGEPAQRCVDLSS